MSAFTDSWYATDNEDSVIIASDGTLIPGTELPEREMRVPAHGAEVGNFYGFANLAADSPEGVISGSFNDTACNLSIAGKVISLKGSDIADSALSMTCHEVFALVDASSDGRLVVAVAGDRLREKVEYLLLDVENGKVSWMRDKRERMIVARSDLFITCTDDAVVGWVPAK